MHRRFKVSRLANSPSTTLGLSADSSTPVLPSLGLTGQSDGFTYSCLYFCLSLRIASRKHSLTHVLIYHQVFAALWKDLSLLVTWPAS